MRDPVTDTTSPRLRPGHRGRIGVIQPAPGVVIEHEWPRFVPVDVLFPVGRVRLTAGTVEAYRRMAESAPAVAQDLASAGADVVAYACSVGSLFAGPEWEAGLVAELALRSGKPALSIADAATRALRQLGARRIAVMTPYDDATNALVVDYARQRGFTVVAVLGLPAGLAQIGNYDAAEIARWAIAALADVPEAEALWIPCTAVRTLAAIDLIEAASGRPVVSGSQALLWDALRTIKIEDPVDCGALLRALRRSAS